MSLEELDPPNIADERTMLNAWLNLHRAILEKKCEGLSAQQLRERAVPPSSLSLLRLVRHMAEVERGWFRRTMRGDDLTPQYLYCSDESPDGDFDNVDDADPAEAFETWKAECAHARDIETAAPSLDAIAIRERRTGKVSLRWIMVHMIEEYARHNGHADFLRERIDGSVGD